MLEILRAHAARANAVAEETLYAANQAMKLDFGRRSLVFPRGPATPPPLQLVLETGLQALARRGAGPRRSASLWNGGHRSPEMPTHEGKTFLLDSARASPR